MGITVALPYETYENIKDTLQDLLSSIMTLRDAMEDAKQKHRPDPCKNKLSNDTINACFSARHEGNNSVEKTRDNIAELYAKLKTLENTHAK
jgi:hypothetical protein